MREVARVAVFLDRPEKQPERLEFGHVGPDSEGEPATGTKNPGRLCEESIGITEVVQSEVGDHTVEGAVPEGQRMCVSDPKLDARVTVARFVDHRLGEVDADGARPALDRRGGCQAGAATNVEDAITVLDLGRVE